MNCLRVFHRDILTVRSHQWKYYVEPYSGCAFQCVYCLYLNSDIDRKPRLLPGELLAAFETEISAMKKKQIVYLGATVDPYQMLEKKAGSTRHILRSLMRHELPVVILTKSPLILRDLDLLQEFSQRNLILVQFTVLTTDEAKARQLERGAPPVAARLDAAAKLSACGIPVHFHLSPVVPGLYSNGELDSTVQAIAENGGQCIYSNILGMRFKNTRIFFESMEKIDAQAAAKIRSEYKGNGASPKNVYSPGVDLIYSEMSKLRDICVRNSIDFICEFMPGLDVFDPMKFDQGIFRYGLPAVYQLIQIFDGLSGRLSWPDFREQMTERFKALDEEYLELLEKYWNDGQLFDNARMGYEIEDGQRFYFRTTQLNSAAGSILSWD
jgi:DNA repair photolyase